MRTDLGELRAGLELLLQETHVDAPPPVRDKVVEFARLARSAYSDYEWELITARIRLKFGVETPNDRVSQRLRYETPAKFAVAARFEELVVDGGFLGDYIAYTKESEAPAQFHFGAMLTCASAAFGRRPLIGWHAAPLYPNIYSLLVGPTGTRKSTALAKARELVMLAFPKGKTTPSRINVLPNEGSPQGYASALRNRNFEVSSMSDGLIIASELTVLVGKETYKQAMGGWLTDWYDNMTPVWARALKGEETYELPAPYVCFAGASNMTWLREIPASLIKAGYMPRHLVFNADVKRHDSANPAFDVEVRDALAKRLAASVDDLPAEMPLSTASVALIEEWYMEKVTWQERGEGDELFAAWLSRKLPHALKVACVWQVIDGGPRGELHADWVMRAIRLIDWMDSGVRTVYHALGASVEGTLTETLLAFIERKGGRIGLSALGRALRNKYNKSSILQGVETLMMNGLLRRESTVEAGVMLVLTELHAASGNGEMREVR